MFARLFKYDPDKNGLLGIKLGFRCGALVGAGFSGVFQSRQPASYFAEDVLVIGTSTALGACVGCGVGLFTGSFWPLPAGLGAIALAGGSLSSLVRSYENKKTSVEK